MINTIKRLACGFQGTTRYHVISKIYCVVVNRHLTVPFCRILANVKSISCTESPSFISWPNVRGCQPRSCKKNSDYGESSSHTRPTYGFRSSLQVVLKAIKQFWTIDRIKITFLKYRIKACWSYEVLYPDRNRRWKRVGCTYVLDHLSEVRSGRYSHNRVRLHTELHNVTKYGGSSSHLSFPFF